MSAYHRNPETPFRMTATEIRVAEMLNQGMGAKQICFELGWNTEKGIIASVRDKQRVALEFKPIDHRGKATLREARGSARTSLPSKGKWKS